MNRQSGVLMHISSLFGDYSIGSFGKNAIEFIDFIGELGFSAWQVLPFTVTDEYNSPYKSFSAFGGNPYFIDLDELYDQGLISASTLEISRQGTPYVCEFESLANKRFSVLREAAENLKDNGKIDLFMAANPRIASFCRFMTLREQNGCLPWQEWKQSDITDESLLRTWQFSQYEFYRQWGKIKAYANKKGISIIGDIPFYVAQDSCDVWENKNLFLLDESNNPAMVAGVPPDYFAAEGQLWGNPLYNWQTLADDSYGWWKQRIDHALMMFDGVRIDHFRAIEAYWAVDAKEKTAKNGKWLKGPGLPFIKAITSGHEQQLIIAEDLGDITDEVRELVEQSGFPGMRVFQFGFIDGSDSLHMPHNYTRNSIAYSGTHDNNTLFGYLWECSDAERKRVLDYCGFNGGDWGKACPYLLRAVFASPSALAIFPIQDLLMYGSDTRMNTPGVAGGNWGYRITKQQLGSIDRGLIRSLNTIYKR